MGYRSNRTLDEREIAFVEMKNQCNKLRRCTKDTKYTQKPKQYGNVDWVPDPFSMETLTFNVGGRRFETYASTLDRDCNCLLSSKTFLQSHYRKDTGEYFFDRDPDVFKCILNYMRTRTLHLPTSVCGPAAKHEFEYWGLSPEKIEQCCWSNYNEWNVTHESLQRLERDRKVSLQSRDECCEGNDQWNINTCWTKKWQCKVWRFLNRPNTSTGAKIYGIISLCFVLLSIFTFHAETTTLFRHHETKTTTIFSNVSNVGNATAKQMLNNETIYEENISPLSGGHQGDKHPLVFYIDVICLTYFVTEYITRFIFAPRKCRFVLSTLSIIDLLAIFPDFIEIILLETETVPRENLDFLNILRVMRIWRIFRLFRHIPGLWIFIYTLQASISELMVLVWFLALGILLFSTLIYFVEGGETFPSIPGGFWWAIITMTTVGYGDAYPKTVAGKIVGCFCAISGLLMIGFTVPSLVNNFSLYYRHIHFAVERKVKDDRNRKSKNRFVSSEHLSTLLKKQAINGITPLDMDNETDNILINEDHDQQLKLINQLDQISIDTNVPSGNKPQQIHCNCQNVSQKCG